MDETLTLVLACIAGGILGVVFFGGLWWTVRNGVLSRQPALWFLWSLLLRMTIALAGFYLVGRGNWKRLVACLVGFVAARVVVMWLTRSATEHQSLPLQEANDAP
jgi:F1F0 ATPase subunit 2